MRVTTAFKHLLRLSGVNVRGVVFDKDRVIVTVALRRRRLVCPLCDHSNRARYDSREVDSCWRHLDLGAWRLEISSHGSRPRPTSPPLSVCCGSRGARSGASFPVWWPTNSTPNA